VEGLAGSGVPDTERLIGIDLAEAGAFDLTSQRSEPHPLVSAPYAHYLFADAGLLPLLMVDARLARNRLAHRSTEGILLFSNSMARKTKSAARQRAALFQACRRSISSFAWSLTAIRANPPSITGTREVQARTPWRLPVSRALQFSRPMPFRSPRAETYQF
jgi:hypothetical protein